MSKINVFVKDRTLVIRCERQRMTEADVQEIDIDSIVYDVKYWSTVHSHSKKEQNEIFYWEKRDDIALPPGVVPNGDGALVLYVMSVGGDILYGYKTETDAYKLAIRFSYKVARIGLSGGYLRLLMAAYVINPFKNLPTEKCRLYVDERNNVPVNLKTYKKQISNKRVIKEKNIFSIKLPLEGLLNDETQINNMLNMMVTVGGTDVDFRIGLKEVKENVRSFYAPYRSCYSKGFAIHLRRTERGNFAIVKRPMEEIEHTAWFRFMESKFVSKLMYNLGKRQGKRSHRNVCLFYEKFSSKAEEGTFELFQTAKKHKKADCYFIIDAASPDYERIKNEKNVIKKFSFKYYWLLYRVNYFISTEAPAHLNLLRSNNRFIRLSAVEHPFVFLQHGVTYMKQQGPTSSFVKGKESEPAFLIVGSEKERDVCCDMLGLCEEQVLNTGLPIFSMIEHGHINEDSDDKAVIMLTWKTYEEQILEFENSEYYHNVMAVYEMLKKYISEENIIIVPHPKMLEHCANTSLSDKLWMKPISEVLNIGKLLITDYSSVCYNTFYQGGGVIFFQPDLERYEEEVGTLIPKDEEYIGPRVFDIDALESEVKQVISEGRISLKSLRNETYIRNYQSINEFSDGENINRIAEELKSRKII